jgi:lipoprotein-anchoring transpeptidase ErfK/SrfK
VGRKILGCFSAIDRGYCSVLRRAVVVIPIVLLGVQRPTIAAELPTIPRDFGPTTRQDIALDTSETPGTIIVSAKDHTLDFVVGKGKAIRYRIGVGRQGFGWSGVMTIGGKATWPWWQPPPEMRARDPSLPEKVPPGPLNPLGARALYIFDHGKDTLYRIHGTNIAASVGGNVTAGCFRMTNRDVMELFPLVTIGAKVIVK